MSAGPLKQAVWMVIGYVLLIPICIEQHWSPTTSTINPFGRAPRKITKWNWEWLNTIYGNREDGVSGAEALVWPNPAQPGAGPLKDGRVLYHSNMWPPLRAWLWSAWRNSTNELSR